MEITEGFAPDIEATVGFDLAADFVEVVADIRVEERVVIEDYGVYIGKFCWVEEIQRGFERGGF